MKKIVMLILVSLLLAGCGNTIIKEQKIVKEEYCERGTFKDGKCKVVDALVPNVTCEDGFDYNSESQMCERIISIDASSKYVCEDGFKLEGGKCISEEEYEKQDGKCTQGILYYGVCHEVKYRQKEYICTYGTLNNTTKKCDIADQKEPLKMVCDDGYDLNEQNSMCEKYTYEDVKLREVQQ